MASRHLSRSIVMQSLFEWDFYGKSAEGIDNIIQRNLKEFGPELETQDFVRQLSKGVIDRLEQIDKIISQAAPEWPLDQITMVDRNVLRIGLYELLYAKKDEVPPKVAINEAIELAKSFGGESSGRFVNGVLGTVFQELEKIEPKEEKIAREETLASGVIIRTCPAKARQNLDFSLRSKFRKNKENYEVAMVKDAFDRWVFPKGHQEPGETLQECILREAKEEVGLENLKVVAKLGEREYLAHEPKEKGGTETIKRKVTDFLLEAKEDSELKVEESSGIKDGKWVGMEQVSGLKQYKETKGLLEQAMKHFNQEEIR